MSRIYKITDRTNNKVYIGQTKRDIYKRFAEHIYRALNSQRKEGKMLENARANGMKVAKKYCNSIKKQLNLLQNILVLWKLADLQVVTADLFNGNYKVNMEIHLLLEVGQI